MAAGIIEKLVDEIDTERRALAATRKAATSAKFARVLRALDSLGISWYVSHGTSTMYVSAYLNGLEGMKDPKLAGVLEYVNLQEPEDITTDDTPEAMTRMFQFHWNTDVEGRNRKLIVSIQASVKTDSPTCRKVEIGKEMKEVVKYKLVCDGDAEAPATE
jgi:hypothetical protein